MDRTVSSFLARAREVSLAPHERIETRQILEQEIGLHPLSREFTQKVAVISLTDLEKGRGLQKLIAFMRSHPLREVKKKPFSLHSLLFARIPIAALACIFLLTAGGGAAFAAEYALPGDPLYPIKIHVTEPLRERLARTPQDRARWIAERLERRLEEAALLTSQSRLSEERRRMIESKITEHAMRLEERLKEITSDEEKNALRTRLEFALERHETLLSSLTQGTATREQVQHFLRKIHSQRESLRKEHTKERQLQTSPIKIGAFAKPNDPFPLPEKHRQIEPARNQMKAVQERRVQKKLRLERPLRKSLPLASPLHQLNSVPEAQKRERKVEVPQSEFPMKKPRLKDILKERKLPGL